MKVMSREPEKNIAFADLKIIDDDPTLYKIIIIIGRPNAVDVLLGLQALQV